MIQLFCLHFRFASSLRRVFELGDLDCIMVILRSIVVPLTIVAGLSFLRFRSQPYGSALRLNTAVGLVAPVPILVTSRAQRGL